jgi:hypothetical protein
MNRFEGGMGELLGIVIDTGFPRTFGKIPVQSPSACVQQTTKTKSQSDRKFALVNLQLLLLVSIL